MDASSSWLHRTRMIMIIINMMTAPYTDDYHHQDDCIEDGYHRTQISGSWWSSSVYNVSDFLVTQQEEQGVLGVRIVIIWMEPENRDCRYQFSCHLCGQKFTQRGGLDNHLMLHAGEQKISYKYKYKLIDNNLMLHKCDQGLPWVCYKNKIPVFANLGGWTS